MVQVVVFSSAEGAGIGVIARQAGASAFVGGMVKSCGSPALA